MFSPLITYLVCSGQVSTPNLSFLICKMEWWLYYYSIVWSDVWRVAGLVEMLSEQELACIY